VEPVAVLVGRLQQPELDEFLQEVFGVGDAGLGQDRGQGHPAVGTRDQGHPPEQRAGRDRQLPVRQRERGLPVQIPGG
jgi:hypothetical protein